MLDLKKTERALALNEVSRHADTKSVHTVACCGKLVIVQTQVQVLSIMDHPNIISLYDSFEESGVLMIEMEYADGG